jgi:hypothetical protein
MENTEMVPQPIKLSVTAYNISREISPDKGEGYIPLISVIEWTKKNPEKFPVKLGKEWLNDTIKELTITKKSPPKDS